MAVGQGTDLHCPSCNSLTIVPSEEIPSSDTPSLLPIGNGESLGLSADGKTLAWSRYDSDSNLETGPQQFATASAPAHDLIGCVRPDGSFAATWSARTELDQPPPHDYADLANVELALVSAEAQSTETIQAHTPQRGSQVPIGLACDPAGGATVVWRSVCDGLRVDSQGAVTSFTPSCTANGILLRKVASNGVPVGDVQRVVYNFGWPYSLATLVLPDRTFLLSWLNRYLLFDSNGSILLHTAVGDFYPEIRNDCSAGIDRCVLLRGGYASIHPSTSVSVGNDVVLKEVTRPYDPVWDVTISAKTSRLSCDVQGICVATWNLVKDLENHDYEDSEDLGIFGRAFNSKTGELGDEVELEGMNVTNIGPGQFKLVSPSGARVLEVR